MLVHWIYIIPIRIQLYPEYCINIELLSDSVDQWNHVRNYWAFFSERYNGYLKSMIKSRSDPHANLVRMMGRLSLVRGMPLQWRQEVLQRWPSLLAGTLLVDAEMVVLKRTGGGASSEVQLKVTRRNSTTLDCGR